MRSRMAGVRRGVLAMAVLGLATLLTACGDPAQRRERDMQRLRGRMVELEKDLADSAARERATGEMQDISWHVGLAGSLKSWLEQVPSPRAVEQMAKVERVLVELNPQTTETLTLTDPTDGSRRNFERSLDLTIRGDGDARQAQYALALSMVRDASVYLSVDLEPAPPRAPEARSAPAAPVPEAPAAPVARTAPVAARSAGSAPAPARPADAAPVAPVTSTPRAQVDDPFEDLARR